MIISPNDTFNEYSVSERILDKPISIKQCYLEGEKLEDSSICWKIVVTKFPTLSRLRRLFKKAFSKSHFISGKHLRSIFNDSLIPLLRIEPQRNSHPLTSNRYFQYFARHKLSLKPGASLLYIQAIEMFLALSNGFRYPKESLMLAQCFWPELLAYTHISKSPEYYPNDPDFQKEYRMEQEIRKIDYSLPKIIHLNENERKKYEVQFDTIGCLLQEGQLLKTSQMDSFSQNRDNPNFIANFTMNATGKLYVGPALVFELNHSSFLSAGPALGAGRLQTNNKGEITIITPHSGHYKPTKKHFLSILEHLVDKGCDLSRTFLTESFGQDIYKGFNSAKAYLEKKGDLKEDAYCYRENIARYIYKDQQLTSLKFSLSTFSPVEDVVYLCQAILKKVGKSTLKELIIHIENEGSFNLPIHEFIENRGKDYQKAIIEMFTKNKPSKS